MMARTFSIRTLIRATSALSAGAMFAGGVGCATTSPAVEGPPATALLDRSTPPSLGSPEELRLPPIITRQLPNGLRLLIVEHDELPVADFILYLGSGSELDPAGKTGLATLTAQMLMEGTTSRSSLEIADQQAALGVRVGAAGGWDGSIVNLHTPTAQLDSALALFADVALRPAFPENELERLRQERLTLHIQLRDRPQAIADNAFNALLFGDQHPYGSSTIGTDETTRALAREDLARFYHTYYRPNNAALVVVGAVKADDIERRARALFGAWERGAVAASAPPEPPVTPTTAVYLIDKPAAPQSSIRIGAIGASRTADDYHAIQVVNTILGGSFTSRLMQNLRESKGYTYGAGSNFQTRRGAGPFVAQAEVTGAKTDSSLIEFMKELRGIGETVPVQELERAKRYLTLQMPRAFETTTDIANQLVPIVRYGLPLDYYDSYARRINAITQADVQRVARRYIDPAHLVVLVVGDRKTIEPGIRALGLGEISIRDLTGRSSHP